MSVITGIESLRPKAIKYIVYLNILFTVLFVTGFIVVTFLGGPFTFLFVSWWTVPIGQFVTLLVGIVLLMIGIIAALLSYGLYQLSSWALTPAKIEFGGIAVLFMLFMIGSIAWPLMSYDLFISLGFTPSALAKLIIIVATFFGGIFVMSLMILTYLSNPRIQELFGQVGELVY